MFDFWDTIMVVGWSGFVYHCYSKYRKASQNQSNIKFMADHTISIMENIKYSSSDQIISGLLTHGRIQPYNNQDLYLECSDPTKNSSTFKQCYSDNFGSLSLSVQTKFYNTIRVEIEKVKISQKLLTKRKTKKNIQNYKIPRNLTLAVLGKIGYDLSNRQFFITAEVIGQNVSEILQHFQTSKTGAIAGLIVLGIIGSIYVIFKCNKLGNRRNLW